MHRRRVQRRIRLRRITHGDTRGFWCFYQPGMTYGDTAYGGRPLFTFKFGGKG